MPLMAVMVPGFVLGFGAIWLAMHNGISAHTQRDRRHVRGNSTACPSAFTASPSGSPGSRDGSIRTAPASLADFRILPAGD